MSPPKVAETSGPASLNAPQPHLPDTSNVMVTEGGISPNTARMDTLFQLCKKMCHHAKSDLATWLRWRWCWGFFTVVLWSNRRGRNVLWLHACCSLPAMDSSSLLVHLLRLSHDLTSWCNLASFSAGSLSSPDGRYLSVSSGRSAVWALQFLLCYGDSQHPAEELKVEMAFL